MGEDFIEVKDLAKARLKTSIFINRSSVEMNPKKLIYIVRILNTL